MAKGGRFEHEDERDAAEAAELARREADERRADEDLERYRETVAPAGYVAPGRKAYEAGAQRMGVPHVEPLPVPGMDALGALLGLDTGVKTATQASIEAAVMQAPFREKFHIIDDPADPLPSKRQVGGDHYAAFPIQPSEYNHRNELRWCEGNVVKYVSRHRDKGGRKDIEKAIHYLELLLEWEYGNG
jgi:hypothetical protein